MGLTLTQIGRGLGFSKPFVGHLLKYDRGGNPRVMVRLLGDIQDKNRTTLRANTVYRAVWHTDREVQLVSQDERSSYYVKVSPDFMAASK